MNQPARAFRRLALILALAIGLAACDAAGPGNVQNLPPQQDEGELEETIEESGLAGQTGLAGQEAQAGDTTQEQIESNIEVYELGSQEGLVAASWLIGREVETMNEVDLGDIEDLLIERDTGQVFYALVEHGGLLDIAEAILPVPLAIFQVREQSELILPVQNPEVWGAFPDLDDSWTTALTPEQASQITAFWAEAGLPVEEAGDLANAQWTSLSSLVGMGVSSGETAVGQLQDLLISLPSGRIKYAVIATTGEDMGARLLPYGVVDPMAGGDTLQLASDFDAALLAESPEVNGESLEQSNIYDAAWDDAHESYWADNGYPFEE